ncbi:hypothetical protein ACOQH0_02665 [Enterobacter sp. JS8-1]|uniref:hypothetical protein n=1 Tax=Enterobacter sp. JS8-1 TaxID=3411633 RepID=UPI003BA38AA2
MSLLIYGLIGGLIPEMVGIYNLRCVEKNSRPAWLTSRFYWISTLVMILIGVALVYFYESILNLKLNEIIAIHIGASAPIILRNFSNGKTDLN